VNLTDRIAEEHCYLLKDSNALDTDDAIILARMIDDPIEEDDVVKTASSMFFDRVIQVADEDCHQDIDTPDFWIAKKGEIIRRVSHIVKG